MKSFDTFRFDSYDLDVAKQTVELHYSYDGQLDFTEVLTWNKPFTHTPNSAALEQALQLLHLTLGISYAKAYLAPSIQTNNELTDVQVSFFNSVYHHGLGEFLYKNDLDFSKIAQFSSDNHSALSVTEADVSGALVPMSGGKDSLLTASILKNAQIDFTPLFVTTDGHYPPVIHQFGEPILVTRSISPQLFSENKEGSYNGHVPFSAILAAILAFTALMYGFSDIILSQESSADEATTTYKGQEINHQFSKSSTFEKAMSSYIEKFIAPNIHYFSLLRSLSETEIHRLFVISGLFDRFEGQWSSCNQANYMQGNDTSKLEWCGQCSKCVNTFIMLAPYLEKAALLEMFKGKNLVQDPTLMPLFDDLLGQSDSKPFECVAEVNEIRAAIRAAYRSGNWEEFAPMCFDNKPNEMARQSSLYLGPDLYQTILQRFRQQYS